LQNPPEQLTVQVDPAWQICVQAPPAQLMLQLPPASQVWVQLPPPQAMVQVESQRWSQPPSLHKCSSPPPEPLVVGPAPLEVPVPVGSPLQAPVSAQRGAQSRVVRKMV
jgi:hypothetical protein